MWSDEDEIASDPEQYDCQTCAVAEAIDGLEPDNVRAWRLYRQIVCKLAIDAQCGNEVLRRLLADVSDDEFPDVWARLMLLHDTLNPAPVTPHGA